MPTSTALSRRRARSLAASLLLLVCTVAGPSPTRAVAFGAGEPADVVLVDLDEDGIPDVVTATDDAVAGAVVAFRGSGLGVAGRTPSRMGERALTERADWLAAGDFDADGHADVAVAREGGRTVTILLGNGLGDFVATRTIELPGAATALAAADVNRADGLADLLVGVSTADGSELLVYEDPRGAAAARPEAIHAPFPVTAIAAGRLTGRPWVDVAAAGGQRLLLVEGRDRKLSLDDESRATARALEVQTRALDVTVSGLAVGTFSDAPGKSVAVAGDDGSVTIFEPGSEARERATLSTWSVRSGGRVEPGDHVRLLAARLTGRSAQDLLAVGRSGAAAVVAQGEDALSAASKAAGAVERAISAASQGGRIAIATARVDGDAIDDVVIAGEGGTPRAIVAQPAATFTVTTTNNDGPGSLSKAILDANASPGADLITFAIPGTGPFVIGAGAGFPAITDPVTVDATTQPGYAGAPVVELHGASFASGLAILAGASTVRGLAFTACSPGIYLDAGDGNVVAGNYVGIDTTGAPTAGQQFIGITIRDTSEDNTIGGTTADARNVISGNVSAAIAGGGDGTRILGNFIGTNPSGTAAVMVGKGVSLSDGAGMVVGGTAPGSRNVVSGNSGGGLFVGGNASALVQGNYFGTDASGSAQIVGDTLSLAVWLSLAVTVGGTTPAARNVVSGTSGTGLSLFGGTDGYEPLVQGNYIGLNASGTAAISNGSAGIELENAADVTIGGVVAGAGNVISGNSVGIRAFGETSSGLRIQGNLIGTNAAGTAAVPNGQGGIELSNMPEALVGGTTAGARNVISGNGGSGIGASSPVRVEQNLIGTDVTGTVPMGNRFFGVFADGSTVGGDDPAAANLIAYNGDAGVAWQTTGGVLARRNSIHSNGGLGLDFVSFNGGGVTPNDPGETDMIQNYPVLASAVSSGGTTTITGTLSSTGGRAYTLDFYSNAACDPDGYGEGETYLGATSVTTAANGTASFTATLPVAVPNGRTITATATGSGGVSPSTIRTSEFSACVAVGPSCVAPAISSQPQSVSIASNQTATLGVGTTGTSPTYQWYEGESGDTSHPVAGATSASFTTPALTVSTSYWVRVSNACGSVDSSAATVAVDCALPQIVSQSQSTTVVSGQTTTLSVEVTGSGVSYQWYVGVSGDTTTPIAGATGGVYTTPPLAATTSFWVRVSNPCGAVDAATIVVTVAGASDADLRMALVADTQSTFPGAVIRYTATASNAGPGSGTGVTVVIRQPLGSTRVSFSWPEGWEQVAPSGNPDTTLAFTTSSFAAGATGTFEVLFATSTDASGPVTGSASIASATADPLPANNLASTTVTIVRAPSITSVRSKGGPFRVIVAGGGFQSGVQVYLGEDPNPWSTVTVSDGRLVLKKGRALKVRFPKGVPITIRVVNPDGGERSTTFTR